MEVSGTVSLSVTRTRQRFCWEDYGLTLVVAENSLPLGKEHCIITITASQSGQYLFSDDSHLVSAVYWIHSEPSCVLSKAALLEIEHCALQENSSKLSVVGCCSQKQLPYAFKKLERYNCSKHSSFGSIQVSRDSLALGIGVAVVQEGCDEREYCASLYYLRTSPNVFSIHFVITWNLQTQLKASLYFLVKCERVCIHTMYYCNNILCKSMFTGGKGSL